MGWNPVSSEIILHWIGGLTAYAALGLMILGIVLGTRRQAGRTTGVTGGWLRSGFFYLVSTILFILICSLGWKPLPWMVSKTVHAWLTAIGAMLYFPGMAFVIWGRLALGKNYFVSTGFGAQLFKGQQLVTRGPFAFIRHPMYSGLMMAGIGSFLIYFTWTCLFFAIFSPLLMLRARREESVLAEEFGDEWRNYCKKVPAFIPCLTGRRNEGNE